MWQLIKETKTTAKKEQLCKKKSKNIVWKLVIPGPRSRWLRKAAKKIFWGLYFIKNWPVFTDNKVKVDRIEINKW